MCVCLCACVCVLRSSVDSEDSNREDHPAYEYGDESSEADCSDGVSDEDGSDGLSEGGLEELRARVVRELAPHIGQDAAGCAVGWRKRGGCCGGGGGAWEGCEPVEPSDDDNGDDDM